MHADNGLEVGAQNLGNNTASRVRGERAFLSQVPPMLRKKIGQENMWSTSERSLDSSTAVEALSKVHLHIWAFIHSSNEKLRERCG